jgi:hypothetical protein
VKTWVTGALVVGAVVLRGGAALTVVLVIGVVVVAKGLGAVAMLLLEK